MARTAEAAARQRLNKLRRRRNSIAEATWQKWITCHLCDRLYCCNNYADRKPRTRFLYGRRCCPTCYFKVRPVIEKLIEEKVLKVRKSHVQERASVA